MACSVGSETEMEKEDETAFKVQFVMSLICALNICSVNQVSRINAATFFGGFYIPMFSSSKLA